MAVTIQQSFGLFGPNSNLPQVINVADFLHLGGTGSGSLGPSYQFSFVGASAEAHANVNWSYDIGAGLVGNITLGTGNLDVAYTIDPILRSAGYSYTVDPRLWNITGSIASTGLNLQSSSANIDFEAHINTNITASIGASANVLNIFHPGFEQQLNIPNLNANVTVPIVHWTAGNPEFNANLGPFSIYAGLPNPIAFNNTANGTLGQLFPSLSGGGTSAPFVNLSADLTQILAKFSPVPIPDAVFSGSFGASLGGYGSASIDYTLGKALLEGTARFTQSFSFNPTDIQITFVSDTGNNVTLTAQDIANGQTFEVTPPSDPTDKDMHVTATISIAGDLIERAGIEFGANLSYELLKLGLHANGQIRDPFGQDHYLNFDQTFGPFLSDNLPLASTTLFLPLPGTDSNGSVHVTLPTQTFEFDVHRPKYGLLSLENDLPVVTAQNRTLHAGGGGWLQDWFSVSDLDDGISGITHYAFWDGGTGTGTGSFWKRGTGYLNPDQVTEVAAGDLDDVWFGGGHTAGSETIGIAAFDGQDWGEWKYVQVTTQNTKATVAAQDRIEHTREWTKLTDWISASDADSDPITRYAFWDGGSGTGSGYFWTPDNPHRNANEVFYVDAANLGTVWFGDAQPTGSEALAVAAFDGHEWGDWKYFNVSTQDTAPTVSVGNRIQHAGTWTKLRDWVSAFDADGDAITRYAIWDGGTGADSGYFWTPDDPHRDANEVFYVDAANLPTVWFGDGKSGGSETLGISAYDGRQWSDWKYFQVTTQNAKATVEATDRTERTGQWTKLTDWISTSDADGDAITRYAFWDGGTGSGSGHFWTPGNNHHDAGTTHYVDAANLGSVWFGNASSGGTETLAVAAYDGREWGDWTYFDVTTQANRTATASVSGAAARTNEWKQVQPMLSVTDADGDAPVAYQFWDGGTAANSGYLWTPSNTHWASNTIINVSAAQLGSLWVRGGQAAGSETLQVKIYDGRDWSDWQSFTFTTVANSVPVATVADTALEVNEWHRVQPLISYTDTNGDAAVAYQFWDEGAASNSGYFWTPSNPHWAANTIINVSAADVGSLWVRGGQAGGSETMYVKVYDGYEWSDRRPFTITTEANSAPVATINDRTLAVGATQSLSAWLSYTDADSDAAVRYEFWDGGSGTNSGYIQTSANAHHPADGPISVEAANLGSVVVHAGSVAGSETMWVRAFDGTAWSAWDSFTLTSGNSAPVASIDDHSLPSGTTHSAASWLSYNDADGDAAVRYEFWDGGSGASSGFFETSGNAHHPSGMAIPVEAADLGSVVIHAGATPDSETMWVRAFDGSAWSAWEQFTFTTTGAVSDDYAANTGSTGQVTVGSSVTGNLEIDGDHDWFTVQLQSGVTYDIRGNGEGHSAGTLHDPYVYLRNASGTQLLDGLGNEIKDDDSGGGTTFLDALLTYTPDTTGTYYIDVGGFGEHYTGTYTLLVDIAQQSALLHA